MQNEWSLWEEREQIVVTEIFRVHEYKQVAKKVNAHINKLKEIPSGERAYSGI